MKCGDPSIFQIIVLIAFSIHLGPIANISTRPPKSLVYAVSYSYVNVQ